MTISRRQCRAARALLDWSQLDVAEAACVTRATVTNFEIGAHRPQARTLAAIRAALEAAGIVFIAGDDSIGPGLRLRDPQKE